MISMILYSIIIKIQTESTLCSYIIIKEHIKQMTQSSLCIIRTILKFTSSCFSFCKFTNKHGEINVCCDFFFDGEDGQINQTILCHRRAQIIFNKLQFWKTAFSWCCSYWECQQNFQCKSSLKKFHTFCFYRYTAAVDMDHLFRPLPSGARCK